MLNKEGARANKESLNIYQLCLLFILALINMQDGFDILAISFAANAITQDWNISRSELGVVFSAGLFGMMIGAMTLSPYADKFGRKKIAIAGLFISGCGMLIAMFAPSVTELVVGRVLTGIGVGGLLASLNTLAAEYAGPRYRSLAVSVFQLGFPAGAFLSGYLAAYILDISTWRYVFAFGAFTSFFFIPIVMLLPESTAFLAKSGKPDALAKINAIERKFGRPEHQALPAFNNEMKVSSFREVATLFSPLYRTRTALTWAAFFSLLTLLYFMLSWTPKILIDMGFSEGQGNQGGRLINLVGMAGSVCIGILGLWLKPSLITCVYMGLMTIIMLGLGFVSPEFGLLILLISAAGFMLHGSMIGLYSTVPALYPANMRATGTGWAIGLSRFGAVLGPLIGGMLLDAGWSAQSLFKAFSILALVTSALAALIYWEQGRHNVIKDE